MTLLNFAKAGIVACALGRASALGAALTFGTMIDGEIDSRSTTTLSSFTGDAVALGFSLERSDYSLASVSFGLSPGNTSMATARVRVYSGAEPTTLLATRSIALRGGLSVAQAVAFEGINISLSEGTTYWLVLDAEHGALQIHNAPGSRAAAGAEGITLTTYRTYEPGTAGVTAGAPIELPNFTMTVPEPKDFALVAALGLTAFAWARRRAR